MVLKLDKHVIDMFTELTKPSDDVKMEKTCFGTISIVDGTRYVKLDGSDLLVPAASTVKTSHGDRVTVLMRNHALTITGNLTAPATDGGSGATGTAATIEVGTVTTGEAGSSASVTNSGTTSKAVFDFVIPRGDKGDPGPQGPKGEKGDAGTWDGTIPEHTHDVSDITDFPESLPANGGNADTLDGLHANEIASNPNLLINPDFAINQRGKTEYTASGYTVDRWRISNSAKLTPHDGYITFESTVDKAAPYLYQIVENPAALSGKTVVLSFDYDLKTEGAGITVQALMNGSWSPIVSFTNTGRSVKSAVINLPDNLTDLRFALVIHGTDSAPLVTVDIYGAKLELGEIATPIIPADPATELEKCQRYLTVYRGNNVRIFGGVAISESYQNIYIQTPVSMRVVPSISYSNMVLALDKNGNATRNISQIIVAANSANHIKIRCTFNNDNKLTIGETYCLVNPGETVGSFILSAEL